MVVELMESGELASLRTGNHRLVNVAALRQLAILESTLAAERLVQPSMSQHILSSNRAFFNGLNANAG